MPERRENEHHWTEHPYERTPWSVSVTRETHSRKHKDLDDQVEWLTDAAPRTLNAIIDGLGETISAGIKGDVRVDVDCRVTGWTILADVNGDAVVDVWRSTYSAFPPTDTDSLTAGNEPTLVASDKARDTVLDGWDVDLVAGDILRFNVDSNAACTRLDLALTLEPR